MKKNKPTIFRKLNRRDYFLMFVAVFAFIIPSKIQAQWTIGADGVYLSDNTKNVGFGTTAPGEKLTLQDGNLRFHLMNGAGGKFQKIEFYENATGNDKLQLTYFGQNLNGGGRGGDRFVFSSGDWLSTSIADPSGPGTNVAHTNVIMAMRPSSGSVGIGTLNPLFKLDVVGEVNATGFKVNGVAIGTGTTGATGPAGPAGPVGATGPAGATGSTGSAGSAGAIGPAGPQGIQGVAGPSGTSGNNIYNSNGALTSERWVDLNDKPLYFTTKTPAASFITIGSAENRGGSVFFANSGHGVGRGYPSLSELYDANNIGLWTSGGGNVYLSGNGRLKDQFILTALGNVGIGTSAPAAKLDVVGVVNATGFKLNGVALGNDMYNSNGRLTADREVHLNDKALKFVTQSNAAAFVTISSEAGQGGNVIFGNPSHGVGRGYPNQLNEDEANNVGLWTTSGDIFLSANRRLTDQFVVKNSGNVGIGTSNPVAKLDVAGQVKISGGVPGVGKVLTSDATGLATWATPIPPLSLGNTYVGTSPFYSTNFAQFSNTALSQSVGGNYALLHSNDGTTYLNAALNKNILFRNNNNDLMILNSAGNLGIGTSAPVAKLDVAGQVKISGGVPGVGKVLTSDATGLATWATPTPALSLGNTYVGTSPFFSTNFAQFSNTALSQTVGGNYALLHSNDGTTYLNAALNKNILFRNNNSDLMILNSAGNLGIGTSAPVAKLDVAGQVKISGGVPGVGKVLTSDATGLATWATPGKAADGNVSFAADLSKAIDFKIADKSIMNIGTYVPPTTASYTNKYTYWNDNKLNTTNVDSNINTNGTLKGNNIQGKNLYISDNAILGLATVGNWPRGTVYPLTFLGDTEATGAYFGNELFTAQVNSYALLQKNTGETVLNAKETSFMDFRIGGVNQMSIAKGGDIEMMRSLSIGGPRISEAILTVDGRTYISEYNEGYGPGGEKGFTDRTSQNYNDYLLWVEEGIVSKDFAIAETIDWPDYVFTPEYKLPSLSDIEKSIKEKGHLPNMPAASDIEVNGFTVSDMTKRVVKTIEEMTLHSINQEKQIDAQKALINNLMLRLEKLEKKSN